MKFSNHTCLQAPSGSSELALVSTGLIDRGISYTCPEKQSPRPPSPPSLSHLLSFYFNPPILEAFFIPAQQTPLLDPLGRFCSAQAEISLRFLHIVYTWPSLGVSSVPFDFAVRYRLCKWISPLHSTITLLRDCERWELRIEINDTVITASEIATMHDTK